MFLLYFFSVFDCVFTGLYFLLFVIFLFYAKQNEFYLNDFADEIKSYLISIELGRLTNSICSRCHLFNMFK